MSPPPPPPAATNKDVGLHAVEDNASVVLPDPLTVEGVPFRRSKAGKFNGGVAAASTSDMFKGAQVGALPKSQRKDTGN